MRANITRVESGPPVGFPVQFRISGQDLPALRALANEVAEVMRGNLHLTNVQFDWDEPVSYTHLDVYKRKAPNSADRPAGA